MQASLNAGEMAILRDRLYMLRHERRWTLETLAKASGVLLQTIWRIENGVTEDPNMSTLVKLANALEVTVDYLIGRSEIR